MNLNLIDLFYIDYIKDEICKNFNHKDFINLKLTSKIFNNLSYRIKRLHINNSLLTPSTKYNKKKTYSFNYKIMNSYNSIEKLIIRIIKYHNIELMNFEKMNLRGIKYLYLFFENVSLEFYNIIFEYIKKLYTLKKLTLVGFNFKNEDIDLSSLINLNKLEIFNCNLRNIKNIKCNNNIKSITLFNHDEVYIINDFIKDFKYIKELQVSDNNMCLIPENIINLKTLISLNLSSNKIKNIEILGNLINLINLELNNNEIIEIPKNFKNLKNLLYLDLNFNKLEIFPDVIRYIENIKNVKLNYNYIKVIPKDILKLDHIEISTQLI